jgi:ribose transport system ATP-binding protein
MSDFALEAIGISKSFEGVRALDKVSLRVKRGEIHALIGENGAGKSTLMRIIAGAAQKDEGQIFLDGKEVNISSPRVGKELGIAIIYQEYILAPNLTVAENIFIDQLSKGKGIINWKKLNEDAFALLAKLDFDDIQPKSKVSDLKVAYQQVVEICKALSRESKILILDEPTAVLTFKEKDKLFELLRNLKQQGVSILFISHRLEEVIELCDEVTVFKDGKFVNQIKCSEAKVSNLIDMMIGRELTALFPARHATIGEEVLSVKGLNRGSIVQDVSFSMRAGEVIGFSGLVGAGRTETMRLVYGADKLDSGAIYLYGKKISVHSPVDSLRYGIGFLPEDRKQLGVIQGMSIRINATLASIRKIENRFRCINKKKEKSFVNKLIDSLSIKLRSMEDNVSTLSGGNQQKVSFSKWIAAGCKCVILDEPTRGVDVGAKAEIYRIINEIAEKGVAVIVVSSEMLELINICDRVVVMRGGRITGEVGKGELTENNLISLAMGVKLND